jgi:hypothetical protein
MTTGWRVWTLRPDGTVPRSDRDRHRSPLLWAECDLLRHDAPDPDCACGLALVPDLRDLLDALRDRPWTCELHPLRALQRGRGLLDALRTGHRPDLLALCTSLGDEQPGASRNDPPGTVRCELLRVDRLWLLDHAAQHAPALATAVGVVPTIVATVGVELARV